MSMNRIFLSFETFVDQLTKESQIYESQVIDFNDEIVSIEEIGDREVMDITVSDNQLFYAGSLESSDSKFSDFSGILIHNCATNNVDADNSTISDSYGTTMTADFLMFLLQTDEMKANGDIIAKITKNRFSGKTESFPLKVDYEFMRFLDADTAGIGESLTLDTLNRNIKETDKQYKNVQTNDKIAASKIQTAENLGHKEEPKSLSNLLEELL